MRFSTLFQSPQPPRRPRAEPPASEVQGPGEASVRETPSAPELPEELDARVRLVGEWQLGDA